jgi:hypothetical protein
MHPMLKTFVGAFASGALVLASAVAAEADVRRFSDPNDTKSGIDIHRVQVDNASSDRHRVFVAVNIDHFPAKRHTRLDVFLDTRGSNAGPEYRLTLLKDAALFRVSGWSDHGKYVGKRCGGGTFHRPGYDAFRFAPHRFVVAIKRGCIGKPGRLRVAVRTGISGGKAHDWARAKHVFLPWVPA